MIDTIMLVLGALNIENFETLESNPLRLKAVNHATELRIGL